MSGTDAEYNSGPADTPVPTVSPNWITAHLATELTFL
jgi:hypothetical protein